VELAPGKAAVLVAELQVLGEVPGKARRKTVIDLKMKAVKIGRNQRLYFLLCATLL
jgi:hypothetical protein